MDVEEYIPTQGLKQIRGTSLTLGEDYSAWSQAPKPVPGTPLTVEVTRGSDTRYARNATVSVRVRNVSTSSQSLYLRREHLTFVLLSPNGVFLCPASAALRAPESQGFTYLKPGRSITLTSRLAEFCPKEALDRPGFYLVAADYDSMENAAPRRRRLFRGTLSSVTSKPVRIQSGERKFRNGPLPSLKKARRLLSKDVPRAGNEAAGDMKEEASPMPTKRRGDDPPQRPNR